MISNPLIDSHINHEEFISVNNVSRKYNEIKEEIKNPKNAVEYTIWKQWKPIVLLVKKDSSVRRVEQNR